MAAGAPSARRSGAVADGGPGNRPSRQRFAEELSEVKTLLSVLQTAPRGQFAPLQQLHEDFTPAREDSVLPSLCRQTALRNAPETDGTYVRVPPVL